MRRSSLLLVAVAVTVAASAVVPSARAADRRATVIAHRGASGLAPEHTFAAYDLAARQGADYLEQDIHLTADSELVVIHDDTLDRTARGPAESCTGSVSTKTLAQLRTCDMGSWFNEAHPDEARRAYVGLRIPTMREVIERYGVHARYYVETKSPETQPGLEDALLALLDETGLSEPAVRHRQVLIQSFSPASLQYIHGRNPALPLIQLLPGGGSVASQALLDLVSTYAVGIGPTSGDVDAALVEAAHDRCLDVHPYTVDDPEEMAALLDAGVDGMFSDFPARLRRTAKAHRAPPVHCRR